MLIHETAINFVELFRSFADDKKALGSGGGGVSLILPTRGSLEKKCLLWIFSKLELSVSNRHFKADPLSGTVHSDRNTTGRSQTRPKGYTTEESFCHPIEF